MSLIPEQEIEPAKLFSTLYNPFGKTTEIPIILIHGLFSSSRSWNPVKCKLSDGTKRTIIAYDLRNHGKSEYCDKNLVDIESDVCDLKHFMDTKSIPRAVLVAHSIGARIAMTFALKYDSMVEMLVVEDMTLTYDEKINQSFRNTASVVKKMSQVFKSFPSSCSEEEAQNKILKFVKDQIPELTDGSSTTNFQVMAPIHKDFKTNEIIWEVNLNICPAMERSSSIYSLDLGSNQVYNGDTLFINSDKSPFSIDHDRELIAKHFPNSYFQNFENGYHAFHQENPAKFIKIVADFINSRK